MRKRLAGIVAFLITFAVVLPIFGTYDVSASSKAQEVYDYLWNYGATNHGLYEHVYDNQADAYIWADGNNQIQMKYVKEIGYTTLTYTMTYDVATETVVDNKVNAVHYARGLGVMCYFEAVHDWKNWRRGDNINYEFISSTEKTFITNEKTDLQEYTFSFLQDISMLLYEQDMSLGCLGFTSRYLCTASVYQAYFVYTSSSSDSEFPQYTSPYKMTYIVYITHMSSSSYLTYKLTSADGDLELDGSVVTYSSTYKDEAGNNLDRCFFYITQESNEVFMPGGYTISIYDSAGQWIWGDSVEVVYGNPTNTLTPTATDRPTDRLTATPTATDRPTDRPTATPTSTSNPGNRPRRPVLPDFDPTISGSGVEGFVSRLYSIVLNREGDAEGQAYWVNCLRSGAITGGDAAREFLNSQEFKDAGWTQVQFIEILYRVFFNRSGSDDTAGRHYWLNVLQQPEGSKAVVINGFINSDEWATVCASYGIQSGGTGTVIIPAGITNFTTRLYTTCLCREADAEGVSYWSMQLFTKAASGSAVAHSYFFGAEFTSQNISNDEYVARLYTTFLGRTGSAAEISYWRSRVATEGREAVFQGFAGSAEFAAICAGAGINP